MTRPPAIALALGVCGLHLAACSPAAPAGPAITKSADAAPPIASPKPEAAERSDIAPDATPDPAQQNGIAAAPMPHAAPASPTSPDPAEAVPNGAPADDNVTATLRDLAAKSAGLQSLKARVRMRAVQGLLGDETVRFGDLVYLAADDAADTPARFRVDFDRLTMDDITEDIAKAYVFDGHWLLEQDDDARTATRRELVAADEKAELGVGEGPFPIPLNLDADKLQARFDIEIAPADPDDDPKSAPESHGCTHLILTPKPGSRIEAVRIDLWLDNHTAHPLRAATLQDDEDQTIVDLFKVELNPKSTQATFDTQLPTEGRWETQLVPLD